MSIGIDRAKRILEKLECEVGLDHLIANLKRDEGSYTSNIVKGNDTAAMCSRQQLLVNEGKTLQNITPSHNHPDLDKLDGSIENFIGFAQIPIGVIGPLRVNGSEAKGDFYVPLATTEGALVASYHRGARACGLSGGVRSICLTEGVRRSPLFGFENIEEGAKFLIWITGQKNYFQEIVKNHTRHGKLVDILLNMEGNHIIVTFEYITGDAAGQNMVTISTDAICQYIIKHTPVKPKYWYVESNYSGDKKASVVSFTSVRGKKVTAECIIPDSVLKETLKTSANAVANYWRASTVSVIQSGSIGAQGHFANGLAALFLATGQDIACISEASVGLTRMEVVDDDSLYVSVTLPNLIIGTVGGGTKFSTPQECLGIMDCLGVGKARKYAEICGALLLCGELSIASALVEGHFTSAHLNLGRNK